MNITDEILYTTKLRVVNAVGSAASIEHDYVDDSLDEVVVAALQAAGPLLIAAELRAQAGALDQRSTESIEKAQREWKTGAESDGDSLYAVSAQLSVEAFRLRARADELDGGA